MLGSIQRFAKFLVFNGFNFIVIWRAVLGFPYFLKDLISFILSKQDDDFKRWVLMPTLADRFDSAGIMSGHYYHQDLYIAREIYKTMPQKHVDIGSRIDGFVAHVASYRSLEVFDIRQITSSDPQIIFKQNDLMGEIEAKYLGYTDSISCLHTIEHFGLGRYGDNIALDGHLKGLDNIYQILKKNGIFYFSTPIGPQRIEFNAHRVFSISYLLSYFNNKYQLIKFAYVDDLGHLHTDVDLNKEVIDGNCGCDYGCGIFILKKSNQ
jgi:SAM-dependent methyltransferase